MTDRKSALFSNEKKIRFTSHARVLYANDKVEDLYRNEVQNDEVEAPKRERCPSLFSFMQVEITRGYVLEHDEERYSARREKVYSFMKIPREVEKFMSYGFMQCADSFLFVYTFLPLRVLLAIWALFTRPFAKCFGQENSNKVLLSPAEICDLLKVVILITCCLMMFYIDTNMIYHLIKSQSVIKLYIFYNMLEVGDRLFSAFGQDTIDALFWTATEPRGRRREHLGVLPHLLFAITYVFLHSLLVLFQATTLNVAINSNNKALLTIMMSNNFVELKGSVFKKFDKNNLFQVSCSDVRERFHLAILLFIVVLQTMKEYSWKSDRFWVLLPDCLIVLTAEIFVDWIKHAFITRFNDLQVDVYKDYTTSLAYDMAQTRQKHAFSDHSDLVARRMGFIPLPLGVIMIRVLAQAVHISDIPSLIISVVAFLSLWAVRVLNSVLILGVACHLIAQHKQEKANTNSPSSNRANSPLPTSKLTHKDWLKDSATSPTKPAMDQTAPIVTQPVVNLNGLNVFDNPKLLKTESLEAPLEKLNIELGSAAIFANSTVDLKNVTLNEELLKVEGEEIIVEAENLSKSDPSINCDIEAIKQESGTVEVMEKIIKKRAESEPNLINCNDEDE
ncbi:PREDICTED: protein TAPT1 homolog [Nicrophorus vespilloides]|uniref:Protein TAPT1 homolog n=1 Tax=Nicrophorus vespilloides TaxID=110193 RepID=A0ABM1NJF9_NICVS|nr:PREDICTED: protein TAPT1 homolog [Nicrophorus vespilloides]